MSNYFLWSSIVLFGCVVPVLNTANSETGRTWLIDDAARLINSKVDVSNNLPEGDTVDYSYISILDSLIREDSLVMLLYPDDAYNEIAEITADDGSFFFRFFEEGACRKATLINVDRTDSNSGERFFDLFIATGEPFHISSVISFNNTDYQGESSVGYNIRYDLGVNENCAIITINSSYEGGDTDYSRIKDVNFYILNENMDLTSILTLVMEETKIMGYYRLPESDWITTKNTTGDFEVLSTSSHGLRDIKVTYTYKADGGRIEEKIYSFDGTDYKEHLP